MVTFFSGHPKLSSKHSTPTGSAHVFLLWFYKHLIPTGIVIEKPA